MKREKFQLGKGKYSNYRMRKHCNQKKENIPITKRKYIEWKLRIEQIMVQKLMQKQTYKSARASSRSKMQI
jgi:hypothetical protein